MGHILLACTEYIKRLFKPDAKPSAFVHTINTALTIDTFFYDRVRSSALSTQTIYSIAKNISAYTEKLAFYMQCFNENRVIPVSYILGDLNEIYLSDFYTTEKGTIISGATATGQFLEMSINLLNKFEEANNDITDDDVRERNLALLGDVVANITLLINTLKEISQNK